MGKNGRWRLDERRIFSESELSAIRRYVRRERDCRNGWIDWFAVELAFESGLRVGEIADLECRDLVCGARAPGVHVRNGKGGKERFVYVRQHFVVEAKKYLSWKRRSGEPSDNRDPLFLSTSTGDKLTIRALQKRFKKICNASGIDHSLHHCRHTFGTALLEASNGNMRFVQMQLGHSSLSTTEVYLHVFDTARDQALKNLYKKSRK